MGRPRLGRRPRPSYSGRIPPGAYRRPTTRSTSGRRTTSRPTCSDAHAANEWSSTRTSCASCARFPNAPTLTWVEMARLLVARRITCLNICRTSWRTRSTAPSSYDRRDATSQRRPDPAARQHDARRIRARGQRTVGEQRRAGRWPCRYSLHHKMSVAGAPTSPTALTPSSTGCTPTTACGPTSSPTGPKLALFAADHERLDTAADLLPAAQPAERHTRRAGAPSRVCAASCGSWPPRGSPTRSSSRGPSASQAAVVWHGSTEEKTDTCAPWLSRAASSARAADSVRRLTVKEVTGADAAFVITLDTKEGRRRMDRMRKSIVGPHITKIDGVHGKALAPEEYAGVVEQPSVDAIVARRGGVHPIPPQSVASHRRLGRRDGNGAGGRRLGVCIRFRTEGRAHPAAHTIRLGHSADRLLAPEPRERRERQRRRRQRLRAASVRLRADGLLFDHQPPRGFAAQHARRRASGQLDQPAEPSIPIYRHTFEPDRHTSFTPRKSATATSIIMGGWFGGGISEIGQHTNR